MATAILATLIALGTPLSWKKTHLAEINTWLGFVVHPNIPQVQMAAPKHVIVMELLTQLIEDKVFTAKEIEKALGRIQWATAVCPLTKSLMQPFWAWKMAVTSSGRPPKFVRLLALLLQHLFTRPYKQLSPYLPKSTWWGCSDASASSEGQAFIGGWLSSQPDPGKDTVWWFHMEITPQEFRWAFKEGDPKKRIAALELFATLILCHSMLDHQGHTTSHVRLPVGSDNQGNVFALLNMASKKPHTAILLMELILTLHTSGSSLAPSHVPRELNQWADELTHTDFVGFNSSLRIDVKAYLAKLLLVRIFFNGKELKTSTATVESIGLSSNICLQVMFAALRPPPVEPVAPIAEPAGKDEVPKGDLGGTGDRLMGGNFGIRIRDSAEAPAEEALSVRIQGTVQGSTSAFVIKELTTCSQVLDLEALSLGAFAPGQGLRPRLFFMGKELKDGNAFLGNVGLKPTSTATVQVMFATGDPRVTARTPVDVGGAAVASASAAAGGRPSPVLEEGTNEAVMAMADAGGCDVSVLTGAQSDAGGGAVASPADAWRAMAGLEEQLSRESDQSEEPSVRQASKMLRQLLTTATHDSNPGLMQMAQTAVPDLKMIWNFEPTREHLRGVLAQSQIQ
eukprot:Skav228740  [mRNA]  locus=scaffold655:292925:297411:- [translate_table: standard]